MKDPRVSTAVELVIIGIWNKAITFVVSAPKHVRMEW
jgi:hypothetical protein